MGKFIPRNPDDRMHAYAIGQLAYYNGRPCSPALDPAYGALIETRQAENPADELARLWIEGWTHENLHAPLPESEDA